MEDITLRALNVLKNSDIILCEDTRRSFKLLNHYGIKNKLISNHKFNEKKMIKYTIDLIKKKNVISMISDAGTPVLSDPGLILIKECIKNNIRIFPIPGASAITTAMSVSGFEDKYLFFGFLPKKEKELEKILKQIKEINFNIIFFIPALKINFYIKHFKKFLNDRKIFIAREMTKIHETFYRDNLKSFAGSKINPKGELTVILSKKNNKDFENIAENYDHLKVEISKYLKRYSLKDVVKLVSEKNNLSKKKVYDLCLGIKKQ